MNHELQVQLFHRNPELAPEMLRGACGLILPRYVRAELGCTDLTHLNPKHYQADGVTVLYDEDGRKVLAIITEPQMRKDEDKPYTWPVYVATVRERLRCPVRLLVICPDRKTAEWARTPIEVEESGTVLRPTVFGPDNTPIVDEEYTARKLPELAVLSAARHGDSPAVLKATMAALDSVPSESRVYYDDYVFAGLSDAAKALWRELMKTGTYEWQSDFARHYVGKGRAEGRAEDIVTFLEERRVTVSDEVRERILGCTDLERLDTWVRRAATVERAEDLFA